MIPRLSGRARQNHALLNHALAPSTLDESPLPTLKEAERVFRQFFRLIERFEAVGELHAPEVKASLRRAERRAVRKTASPKNRLMTAGPVRS